MFTVRTLVLGFGAIRRYYYSDLTVAGSLVFAVVAIHLPPARPEALISFLRAIAQEWSCSLLSFASLSATVLIYLSSHATTGFPVVSDLSLRLA